MTGIANSPGDAGVRLTNRIMMTGRDQKSPTDVGSDAHPIAISQNDSTPRGRISKRQEDDRASKSPAVSFLSIVFISYI